MQKIKSKSRVGFVVVKLCGCSVVSFLYFWGMCLVSRNMYSNCFFFDPGFALFPCFLIGCTILFSSFLPTHRLLIWLRTRPRRAIGLILSFIVFFIFSIISLRAGILINENGIQKMNLMGQMKESYSYSDIKTCEISFQYGIQYDIEFESGESLSVMSHQVIFFNAFKSDHYMMVFDKLLAQHVTRHIHSSYRSLPENTERFFKENEAFEYFNQLFNSYSNNSI